MIKVLGNCIQTERINFASNVDRAEYIDGEIARMANKAEDVHGGFDWVIASHSFVQIGDEWYLTLITHRVYK